MNICRRRALLVPRRVYSTLHSNEASVLGLRSTRPPDTPPDPNAPQEITDAEWELRTGRAIFVLQRTLPEFFHAGLVTSIDTVTGGLRPLDASDTDSIYSPNVRLSYTPPAPLPSPLPQTLHIEGISMYLASSVFVRHTLNALYTDTQVTLNKIAVDPLKKGRREKSLIVDLTASGIARVSGAPNEWEVYVVPRLFTIPITCAQALDVYILPKHRPDTHSLCQFDTPCSASSGIRRSPSQRWECLWRKSTASRARRSSECKGTQIA
ncbi:hypothetical protein MKEN_00717600 [Mycena kentingensis (nom. inval.)]|nr:hypothetical protein MKEN_00717600 [Mycena kentingensis (nom. inval.)]